MKTFLKSRKARLTAALSAVAASGQSFAADYSSEITAATTDGTANVALAIGGVIAVAVLGFGVGRMLGWFGR